MSFDYIVRGEYAFFYGGCFSQWYACKFHDEEREYSCAEQRMMYMKAKLFGDSSSAKKIMKTKSPKEQKALGRNVSRFDKEVWEHVARNIVFDSNLYKFTQNPFLKKNLLSTGKKLLVEASPYDAIWGIRRALSYPHLGDKSTWRGTNWLGLELTKVKLTIMRSNKC